MKAKINELMKVDFAFVVLYFQYLSIDFFLPQSISKNSKNLLKV